MARPPRQHVTLVEDDPDTLRLLERQLRRAGYEVSAFADATSALQAVRGGGSTVVLADWEMPGMSGVQLCAAVRELQDHAAAGSVYFILLTARAAKDQVIEGLAAGANDYLTKPYHIGELLARIQVGHRMLSLQDELIRRHAELQKVNAEMAALAAKLEQLANSDALTGLANRRSFFQQAADAFALATRHARPLACVALDVDHFKRVNDDYGHDCGDNVLRCVAAALRGSTRRADLVARIGGEEFVVLCPETGLHGAAELAERMRHAVGGISVEAPAGAVRVTVSLGVAQRHAAHRRVEQLLADADAMLYQAKRAGRDQTWIVRADGQRERFCRARPERPALQPADPPVPAVTTG